jgi:hypothetical protein
MGRTGPPLRTDQASIHALGIDTLSEPIVSDLRRAGQLLRCDPDRLEDAVDAAQLAPWGAHASGLPVWRWPELCEAAAAVGIQVPRTRPTLAAYRQRRRAKAKAVAARNRKHR